MTNLTQDQIFERYSALRRRGRIVVTVGILLAFVLPFATRAVTFRLGLDLPGAVGFGLGFGLLVLVAVWAVQTWRCPKCGVYLSSRPISRWSTPNACRGCGVRLEPTA